MSDFTYNVADGTSSTSSTSSTLASSSSSSLTATTGSSTLDKDAFLQLLVTQMQYQDPLNPQTDTAFVAQLAQFSSLEQMQNLNSTFTQSQAFSLVGKKVIVATTDSSGNSGYVSGPVDFVTMINGAPYLSIYKQLYPASQLDTVLSEEYVKDTTGSNTDSSTNTDSTTNTDNNTTTDSSTTTDKDTTTDSSTDTDTNTDDITA